MVHGIIVLTRMCLDNITLKSSIDIIWSDRIFELILIYLHLLFNHYCYLRIGTWDYDPIENLFSFNLIQTLFFQEITNSTSYSTLMFQLQ